ncbi:MAG: hypothetical protein V1704_01680 [Candidatus Vogelbacteria bacterium]
MVISIASAVKSATLEKARAIFVRGTDCLGPEEVMNVHGKLHRLKLPKKLPDLPWSMEELQAAHARDESAHLILVPPGLMMQAIYEKRKNLGRDGGKLLYDIDWYKAETFFTTATTGEDWDWRLVTNKVIPNSTSPNYVEQTATIADYLTNVVFAGRDLLPVYRQAVDEFKGKEQTLTKLINDDWQEAAKQLSMLALNRLLRGTPAFTFYDWVTYLEVNGERLLESSYHWTSALSSPGSLLNLGGFARVGASAGGCRPRSRCDGLGVVLSRSALVESEK